VDDRQQRALQLATTFISDMQALGYTDFSFVYDVFLHEAQLLARDEAPKEVISISITNNML
jgi:hypothetical protein